MPPRTHHAHILRGGHRYERQRTFRTERLVGPGAHRAHELYSADAIVRHQNAAGEKGGSAAEASAGMIAPMRVSSGAAVASLPAELQVIAPGNQAPVDGLVAVHVRRKAVHQRGEAGHPPGHALSRRPKEQDPVFVRMLVKILPAGWALRRALKHDALGKRKLLSPPVL